jgi:hypothetical protein
MQLACYDTNATARFFGGAIFNRAINETCFPPGSAHSTTNYVSCAVCKPRFAHFKIIAGFCRTNCASMIASRAAKKAAVVDVGS